jgi:hypothetical protein
VRPPKVLSGKDVEAPTGSGDQTSWLMASPARRGPRPAGPDALDFWVGDWTCTWEGGAGRNRISKELDDRVVVERFESHEPQRWSGMSVSVFQERPGWRQTWVDSNGNYWAFDGEPLEDGFTFHMVEIEDGRAVAKRMLFADIRTDALDWRWERSTDEGATWETLWSIRYERTDPGVRY